MKRVFLLLLACCLLIAPAAAAGGSGTSADPYIIQTAAELQSVQNNLAAYYVLGNDINMQDYSFTSIGSTSAPFSGQLDGNGYSITNLQITSTSTATGFFSAITAGATIKDISFVKCSISGTSWVGVLTGVITSSSSSNQITLNNVDCTQCTVLGTTANVGILCGLIYQESNVNIINCDINLSFSSITNTGSYNCGGFFGSTNGNAFVNVDQSTIKNSIVIVIGENTGGISGAIGGNSNAIISNTNIENCIAECIYYSSCGGVSGKVEDGASLTANNIYVKYCTIKTPLSYVGGICGYLQSSTLNMICTNCKIIDCSLLAGTSYCAGICPESSSNSISSSTVLNTNVYTRYNAFDIGPSGSYDSTSTASGITNVPNRYLYASGLTATPNGATVSYTLEGQQGSTTVEATQGTAQSWAWTFGDGATSTVAEDTTHTYAAPGTYTTSLTLKNYLDSTGITVTTSGYNILPIPPTVSASANVLQLGQSTTLSAVGTLFSTIQWQYSTDSGATWQDISGATTATYEWTPTAGVYQVRAHVTAVGTGFTADSNVLTISAYAPPTINAVTVSPTIGQYTQTITLSAEVTDSGPAATTYQWQQSPGGQNTWTNIPGATTAQWIGQLTVSGATDFRLIAVGIGGQTISDTVTYYVAAPGEIQSLTATPSVVALPGSTTLTASGSNILSWEWQEYTNGVWTPIGYSASLRESLTSEGVYQYRVLATGANGVTITSETVEVLSGYAPTVDIISPVGGTQFPSQSQINLSATVTGTDVTYQWDFGSPRNVNGGNTNPTWVTYLDDGQYTITLRAESIFGSISDSVTIISGVMPRPMATEKFDAVSTAPVTAFVESFNVPQGEILDLPAVFGALTAPMSDLLPDGMFMVIVFGVIFIMLWIMTKNTAVPSIIGLIFGGFILALLPASYNGAAVVILAISIVGGVIRVFIPPK